MLSLVTVCVCVCDGQSLLPTRAFLACPFLEKKPEAAPQVSRGVTTQGSDTNRSPCWGLVLSLGKGRRREEQPHAVSLHLRLGAVKTQRSKVSKKPAGSSFIMIKQSRPDRPQAAQTEQNFST